MTPYVHLKFLKTVALAKKNLPTFATKWILIVKNGICLAIRYPELFSRKGRGDKLQGWRCVNWPLVMHSDCPPYSSVPDSSLHCKRHSQTRFYLRFLGICLCESSGCHEYVGFIRRQRNQWPGEVSEGSSSHQREAVHRLCEWSS